MRKIADNNGYLISNLHNFTPTKIINSNHITTRNLAFPILANNTILYPNSGDYIFPTKQVIEKPLINKHMNYFQMGGAQPPQDQGQQIIQMIMQALQQGKSPQEILQFLVQQGMPQEQAQQLIQAVVAQMQQGPQQFAPEQGMEQDPYAQDPSQEYSEEVPEMRIGGRLRPYKRMNYFQMGGAQQGQGEQVAQAIMQALQQGTSPQEILQYLVQQGMPQEQAQQLIQAVASQAQQGQELPQMRYGGHYRQYAEGGELDGMSDAEAAAYLRNPRYVKSVADAERGIQQTPAAYSTFIGPPIYPEYVTPQVLTNASSVSPITTDGIWREGAFTLKKKKI